MRRLGLALALLAPSLAGAQSLPDTGNVAGFYYTYRPSAKNWNTFLSDKQDWIGAHPYTVATLPTCNGTTQYYWAAVTDADNSSTYNQVVVAGGANHIPVFCDGTNWRAH